VDIRTSRPSQQSASRGRVTHNRLLWVQKTSARDLSEIGFDAGLIAKGGDRTDVSVGADHDAAAVFQAVALGDGSVRVDDDVVVAGNGHVVIDD
jgi:hypothetical protein